MKMFENMLVKAGSLVLALSLSAAVLTGCSGNSVSEVKNDLDTLLGGLEQAVEGLQDVQDEENERELPVDLQTLVDSVVVAPADENAHYDRDLYTSSYQYYECDDPEHVWHDANEYTGDDGGEFSSIRAYGFYESKWYDADTDSYTDPYTNETVDVSEDGPKGYDWDHIIPLAYADAHGANGWSEEEKKAFADDPMVGVCVNASDNRSKGSDGPSEWLPDENVGDYCYTWLLIASEYGLSIAEEDMEVIIQYVDESSLAMVG